MNEVNEMNEKNEENEKSVLMDISESDARYIRRYGMTREAIRETIIRVQRYAVGLMDAVESFLGKEGNDYGEGLDVLNDIKDRSDCPHDRKLFAPIQKNAQLFMTLISGRTSWGGHTSAIEACVDSGLDPDRFGTLTEETVESELPEECDGYDPDADPKDDHIDEDIQAADMESENQEDNDDDYIPFC